MKPTPDKAAPPVREPPAVPLFTIVTSPIVTTALAALLLAACATPSAEAPKIEPPAQFRALAPEGSPLAPGNARFARAAPAAAEPRGQWWMSFADPVLDDLVARAATNNTGIRQAAARWAQARALARGAGAERLPSITAGASAERAAGANLPSGPAPATLLQGGASLSYELDLFDRIGRASDAARLDALSSEALLQSARLLVQSEVARTYLALRALDEERALVREAVTAYGDTLRLVQSRYRAGDLAELDVARVLTEMASTESEALALDRRRTEFEHALALLVGEAASSFELAAADWTTVLPVIPAGVPARLLTRRPDVSAAQAAVIAAQARLGVAQAAWFPSISLTAAGGFASPELGDLFQWSARAWGIGALLALPLFDGGRRASGVDNAAAGHEESLAAYREQVLVAFKDVEDQLAALRLLAEQSDVQRRAVESARRATTLSESRYRNGMVSQLELLDARRSEVRNRREALQVQAARYQATVALIRALGGGWDAPA